MRNPDPQPQRAGIGESHKSTYVIASNTSSLLLIWSPSHPVGHGEFGRSQHSAVLAVSSFFPLRRELPVAREMRRLSVWRPEVDRRQEAASLALLV